MYKWLCFVVSSAFSIIVTALPVFAQTVPPTAMASSPAYVAPKGTGLITGRVVYEGGQPAADVVVVAAMQSNALTKLTRRWQHRFPLKDDAGNVFYVDVGSPPPGIEQVQTVFATTAADGSYRLSGVITAPYNVMTAPRGATSYPIFENPWDWVAVADEGVAAQQGRTVKAPDFVLTHGDLISGRVVEAKTGRPLSGIVVAAQGPARPASSDAFLNAVTDADGRYNLRVAPGNNRLFLWGQRLNSGSFRFQNQSMKFDNALWSMGDYFEAVVDGGKTQKASSSVGMVSVETLAGQTHQVIFRLPRGKLQYRFTTPHKRSRP